MTANEAAGEATMTRLLAIALLGATSSQERADDIIVEGVPEIVVKGIPPRCKPREGDPQDAVDLRPAAAKSQQQIVRRDPATGRYVLAPDDYPTGTRTEWQRDGTRLDNFVFRVPVDDGALCIGAVKRNESSFAQLRRAFPARPLWGRYVVFSAEIATRNAERVDMWIAAGVNGLKSERLEESVVAGGPKRVPLRGNYRWQRVNLLMGPVPCLADQVSYGVTLRTGGDVWMRRPVFVEVPEAQLSPSMRKRPHGSAMLRSDPVCRHRAGDDVLWKLPRHPGGGAGPGPNMGFIPMKPGEQLTPRSMVFTKRSTQQFDSVDLRKSFAPGITEF
jgi:hypothetical protein